jgi:hypothetical protein
MPTLVQTFHLSQRRIVQVAAGNAFSAVLDASGRVWTFGKAEEGQVRFSPSCCSILFCFILICLVVLMRSVPYYTHVVTFGRLAKQRRDR